VGTWIPAAHQRLGVRIQVLLRESDALSKWRRRRLVENANTAAWSFSYIDPIKAGVLFLPTGRKRPDLSWSAAGRSFAGSVEGAAPL